MYVYRVYDCIAAGLDSNHTRRLRAQTETSISPIPSKLPSDGWTSSLNELPPFNYSCHFCTHLVTDSPTTAKKNQRITAAASYRVGTMKHKEEGYHLFRDNHVMMV